MSTNGHIQLSEEEINRIMDEWVEITHDIVKQLHGSILKDSRPHEEREMEIILATLIQLMFPLEGGAEPNELNEEGIQPHCMWDYPSFARRLAERAREKKTSVRGLIKWAFSPKFQDRSGRIITEEPIDSLKKALLRSDGRNVVLGRLLGENEVSRFNTKFKYGISSVSKRRKPDRSDDPEELKIIPVFTAVKAE